MRSAITLNDWASLPNSSCDEVGAGGEIATAKTFDGLLEGAQG